MELKILPLTVAIVALLIISCSFPAIGDDQEEPVGASVSGYVYDSMNEKPVRDALVIIHMIGIDEDLAENTYFSITNGMGFYEFPRIPAGDYRILVFAPGYSDFYWELIRGPVCGIVAVPPYYDDLPPNYYYTLVCSYEMGLYSAYCDQFDVDDGQALPMDLYIEPEVHYSMEHEHRLWSNLVRNRID
jgi:hypothetical protein